MRPPSAHTATATYTPPPSSPESTTAPLVPPPPPSPWRPTTAGAATSLCTPPTPSSPRTAGPSSPACGPAPARRTRCCSCPAPPHRHPGQCPRPPRRRGKPSLALQSRRPHRLGGRPGRHHCRGLLAGYLVVERARSGGRGRRRSDVCRVFFLGHDTRLFFPPVLAQTRCKNSRFTGYPNGKYHLESEKPSNL
ncbi:hypothetical protein BS78_01G261500 [Paspalum vaginatum]|nr:hypothetical protein BS78_01G261500 [Paspalum vaginatum]